MVSLRLISLVFVTLGCRELAKGDSQSLLESLPQDMSLMSSLAALGVALGFGLLFRAAALRMLVRSGTGYGQICWEQSHRARQRIELAWLATLPAALLATGWGESLHAFEAQGLPQAVALMGWFLPSLLLIVLLELTAAQLDELCRSPADPQAGAPPAVSPRVTSVVAGSHAPDADGMVGWPEEWLSRLRLGDMAGLVACIMPLLVIASVTDVLSLVAEDVWTARCVIGATLLSLVGVVLFLPVWLGRWMGVVELPAGEMKDRLQRQCRTLGIGGVRTCWLSSRGRWQGAAVVGWFPHFRQLWLGDGLVDRLSTRELDMVVMHELAHLTRRHFLWRVFPIVWGVATVAAFGVLWPVDMEWLWLGKILSGLMASLVLIGGLRVMAHVCELDADRSACALARQACPWAEQDLTAPAQELSSALKQLLQDSPAAAAATWLHPSLRQRLSNLQNRAIPTR